PGRRCTLLHASRHVSGERSTKLPPSRGNGRGAAFTADPAVHRTTFPLEPEGPMPKKPQPWYRAATGWWMAQVDRKQVKLHQGPHNDKARRLARLKLDALLNLRDAASDPESRRHTVAGIIELYLRHASARYAERSLYERRLLLQDFAELHG